MNKIYLITCWGGELGDMCYSSNIEYITESLDEANKKMDEFETFCKEHGTSTAHYYYEYELVEYGVPYNVLGTNWKSLRSCDNGTKN